MAKLLVLLDLLLALLGPEPGANTALAVLASSREVTLLPSDRGILQGSKVEIMGSKSERSKRSCTLRQGYSAVLDNQDCACICRQGHSAVQHIQDCACTLRVSKALLLIAAQHASRAGWLKPAHVL